MPDVIKIPDNTGDESFAILKAVFPEIEPIDPHLKATVSGIFHQAVDKVIKKKSVSKVSKKQTKKIRDIALMKMRTRFGKWINLSGFRWTRRGGFKFGTNCGSVFKTKLGRLYGHDPVHPLRQVFYTSHCLSRFDERIAPEIFRQAREYFRIRKLSHDATAFDVLDFEVMLSRDYGVLEESDHYLLNVGFGAIVLHQVKNVYIAKTFLTPQMVEENRELPWYKAAPNEFDIDHNSGQLSIETLDDLFNYKRETCVPSFFVWD